MELRLYRHLWGVTDPLALCLPRFREKGYHGIEFYPAGTPGDPTETREAIAAHGFQMIIQMLTEGATVQEHLASLRQQVEAAKPYNPVKVNIQSGRDAFSDAEAEAFFNEALAIEADAPFPFAHEVHRGKILFNPWRTARLLERFDDLKLTTDLSHFVCVCERLLDTEGDIIAAMAQRTIHLHARVGFEEGPQVPDPRAPEYQIHLEAHESWWRSIWQSQHARGLAESTLTPEFGPPGYQHTLPYTRQPLADLEEVVDWMAERERQQFAAALT